MKPMKPGTMVFWRDKKPHWIIKWQPKNGSGAYWIVDANGNSGVAEDEDLTLRPKLNESMQ